jgi:hypothetical protein
MMPAVDFPEANFTFHKPKDMTDEQCMPLQVWRGLDGGGIPLIISKWSLSAEDLEEIKKTESVYLVIVGTGMPPVSLHVETPFVKK